MTPTKSFVSLHAAMVRANRHLAKVGQVLKKSASHSQVSNFGSYFIADLETGQIIESNFDLEAVLRAKMILKSYEALA